jgi:hypothetical protein
MKPETNQKVQNAFLAAIAGVAVPLAIGFGGGFWITKGDAERTTNEAVLAARAQVCVGQFTDAPNYQERLKAYKALDYSAKGVFIEKGGWAKMPGEEKANDAVKQSCANALDTRVQK